jgi:hypothetical protein
MPELMACEPLSDLPSISARQTYNEGGSCRRELSKLWSPRSLRIVSARRLRPAQELLED